MGDAAFHLAQLRHLYVQMLGGHVADVKRAASGLLGPAITGVEDLYDQHAQLTAERDRALERVGELEGALEASRANVRTSEAFVVEVTNKLDSAEQDATALRAEVERLRADYRGMAAAYDSAVEDRHALRAALRRQRILCQVFLTAEYPAVALEAVKAAVEDLDAALGSSDGGGGEAGP